MTSSVADDDATTQIATRLIEAVPADEHIDDPAAAPKRRPDRRWAWLALVVVALAVAVPAVAIVHKRAEVMAELARRLDVLATGRAEVLTAWLEGLTRPVDRVVGSEMFRLFATEIDLARGDIADLAAGAERPSTAPDRRTDKTLDVPLSAQIPFMAQVLTDFAKAEGFLAGYLINRDGVAYVATGGAPELTPAQRAIAARVLDHGTLEYGPLRGGETGLVLDIFAPVFPAQRGTEADTPVGVALLSVPVSERLAEILRPPPLSQPGERLRLLQRVDDEVQQVAPGLAPPLRPVAGITLPAEGSRLPFAARSGIGDGVTVYSAGAAVGAANRGANWWMVQEIEATAARRPIVTFAIAAGSIAVLVVLAVAAAFGAFWWRLANDHNAAMAAQYRTLAARIEAQKRLLDSINATITDHIGLKDLSGTYRYVNPAFARAVGRPVDQIVGLDDAAIFGRGTADRLKHAERRALAADAAVTTHERIYLDGRLHHLQITRIPFRNDTESIAGIVSVTRDITDLIEEQERRERAQRQMVAALVRAVELRDPYLAGHSRRVAGFAAAVAERLGAGAEDVATVEIAANLSQIGKLGVPREILAKPERLTGTEIKTMQRHIEHAIAIVREIDFDLPVLATIEAMHERLDGSGYPRGLRGSAIPLGARILGVCDWFCARVEPRSYRQGIAPEEALRILEDNVDRYDPQVVAALRAVVGSVTGEKLMADLGVA
ncbi:MAG: HD domain-containing protein [Alphaproteobacteria bacterium]|nr:MAG: HD domain-containing protein [Alphaproteobacteria bacterium]